MPAHKHEALLQTLEARFAANMRRHPDIAWKTVAARLTAEALRAIDEMETTGGEPDVVALDQKSRKVAFVDCAPESPAGRRSLCFDRAALDARKENKPRGSAQEMAAAMGAELLTEAEYRALQTFGDFDLKTSSWIATPAPIRKRGGALFCDRRYDTVFVYHNGAESYYAARGFRARIEV